MSKRAYNLSLIDTTYIKAIAIIVIVLHNFLHWTNSIGENELSLNKERIYSLANHIVDIPLGSINYLLSYFGWYLITPFIFISGYGLTIKLMRNASSSVLEIVSSAIFKTVVLLIIGSLYVYFTGYLSLNDTVMLFVRKVSTIDNLFHHTIFYQIGPWWYFSLVIQLYIVFIGVNFLVKKYNAYLVIVIFYMIIYFIYYNFRSFNVFGTAIGHLPELTLGIALARGKILLPYNKKMIVVFFISFFIFILSNRYTAFFPLTYLTFLILFLMFFNYFKVVIKFKVIYWIGILSPFIFLLNGPIRKYTMTLKSYVMESYSSSGYEVYMLFLSLLHLFAVVVISFVVFLLSEKVISYSNKIFQTFLDRY